MKKLYFLLFTLLMTTSAFAQVIITEIADPNSNAAARYVEIYNVGATNVDLTGYNLQRWTNGNAGPTTAANILLTPIGILTPGQFATIAASQTAFTAAYGMPATLEGGTGGPVDSNGDDQIAILDDMGAIVDIFGVPGEDGSGTCHEFEDGRAERKAGITMPVAVWNEAEWNVWADSAVTGCTSHTNMIQETGDFDPGAWIGTATGTTITVGADVTGLDYFEGNGPSAEQTFSVEGINLMDDITVTPPANFEISTTSGAGFATTPIVLTEAGGTVTTQIIYVRLASGLTSGPYAGDATVSSGATTEMVNLSGTVSPAVPQFTVSAFLDPFDYVDSVGGPSPEQTFTVEGLFLGSDLTVTAPANFEVSLTTATGFASSVAITPDGSGTVANTTIYARLATGLAIAAYSGDITVSATSVTDELIAVTGNVYGPPTNSLVLTAVYDGPLTGGTPKGVEIYVLEDIADLSLFGLGSAGNGGGTDGQEFTFPAVAATTGSYIYVASESPGFTSFFGFAPDYTTGAMAINGDDAVELFENGQVIDTFGEINVDGTGQPWEHLDGWAYRVSNTGPDGSTFVLANWTFSGINALDGETTNATAVTPIPIGTYENTLSTEDFATTNFSLYPNPTNTGFVNITTTSNEAVNVAVFDILGKQVISQTLNNNRLNVSNLTSGVYILKLSQNGASTTKKLVIK